MQYALSSLQVATHRFYQIFPAGCGRGTRFSSLQSPTGSLFRLVEAASRIAGEEIAQKVRDSTIDHLRNNVIWRVSAPFPIRPFWIKLYVNIQVDSRVPLTS